MLESRPQAAGSRAASLPPARKNGIRQGCREWGDAGTRSPAQRQGSEPAPGRGTGGIQTSPAKFVEGNSKFPFPFSSAPHPSCRPPSQGVGGGRGRGEAALNGATNKSDPKIPDFHSGCSHTPGPRPLAPLPLPSPNRINRHLPKSKSEFVKSSVTVDLLTISTFLRHGDSTARRQFNRG